MKLIFILCLSVFLVLAGCNSDDKVSTKSQKTKTDIDSKKTENHKDQGNSKKDTNKSAIHLSDKQRLALAFYADEAGQYTLTKNEILTGIYEYKKGTETEKAQTEDILLEKMPPINNAPTGMHFYYVYPPKGQFASIIGMNKDKIFMCGTQGAVTDYQLLLKSGIELDINNLYQKNKYNKSLPEMEKKIKIVNRDESIKLFDPDKNNIGMMAHMRSQLYRMIREFGGELNNNAYLWDNIRLDKDGNWTVNYRNHDGEILGTYKFVNDKLIKLDQNGNKIKEKKITIREE